METAGYALEMWWFSVTLSDSIMSYIVLFPLIRRRSEQGEIITIALIHGYYVLTKSSDVLSLHKGRVEI